MGPIAHSSVGLLGWQLASARKNLGAMLLFITVANLPDADFLVSLFLNRPGRAIHQHYTHNLVFIGLLVLFIMLIIRKAKERLGLAACAFSHLLLDLMVIDRVAPVGIRLFFPFSKKLFYFGFFPYLERSSLKTIFSVHNLFVLMMETTVFLLPVVFFFRKELFSIFRRRDFWRIR